MNREDELRGEIKIKAMKEDLNQNRDQQGLIAVGVGVNTKGLLAMTYSPRGSRPKYHRRWRALLPGSGWVRAYPRRSNHQETFGGLRWKATPLRPGLIGSGP